MTTERTSWGNLPNGATITEGVIAIASQALRHTRDLFAGVFIERRYSFHQEILPPFFTFPIRHVPWMVAAAAVVGLLLLLRNLRSPTSLTLLAWFFVALLPAILAREPYIKRGATLVGWFIVTAALAIATALRASQKNLGGIGTILRGGVYGGAILWSLATVTLWLSGRIPIRPIPELLLARRVASLIEPGTVVINRFSNSYLRGKMAFLLLPTLEDPARHPVLWYSEHDANPTFTEILTRPLLARRHMDRSFEYWWTPLRDKIEQLHDAQGWKKVVFLLQREADGTVPFEDLVQQGCPAREEESFDYPAENQREHRYRIIVCHPTPSSIR
jgi:hypothetical protein